jgi:hypothetical protein
MAGHVFANLDTRFENPAGLAGVWAEENTRLDLHAMQRRETFAVSRPTHQAALLWRLELRDRRPEPRATG